MCSKDAVCSILFSLFLYFNLDTHRFDWPNRFPGNSVSVLSQGRIHRDHQYIQLFYKVTEIRTKVEATLDCGDTDKAAHSIYIWESQLGSKKVFLLFGQYNTFMNALSSQTWDSRLLRFEILLTNLSPCCRSQHVRNKKSRLFK